MPKRTRNRYIQGSSSGSREWAIIRTEPSKKEEYVAHYGLSKIYFSDVSVKPGNGAGISIFLIGKDGSRNGRIKYENVADFGDVEEDVQEQIEELPTPPEMRGPEYVK